jgi:hypothetical protein
MLTIKLKTFHYDPSGIYFFPETFSPETSMWKKMKYKFIATLKPDARVLDLPRINDQELETMLTGMDASAIFHADLQHYPLEGAKKIKRAWEILRERPAIHGGSSANWNKIIRGMGYDAVFDDAGIIHFAEPIQLLVLNPRILNIVAREQPKGDYFAKMNKVIAELKAICEPFGEVTIEGPKMMSTGYLSGSPKALAAKLNVNRSEENYADFSITRETSPGFEHVIGVHLRWSKPHLNYGVGAQFNGANNVWEYDGLDGIKRDLERIFAPETP